VLFPPDFRQINEAPNLNDTHYKKNKKKTTKNNKKTTAAM